MEIEELGTRLGNLEDAFNASRQQAKFDMFMNKYGPSINNDDSIGLAILNEMDRRGLDVSAADDAFQEICDQLRSEAMQVIDNLKGLQNQVTDLMTKLDGIDQSVQAAVGPEDMPPAPDAGMAPPPAEPPAPPMDMPPAPDAGMAPPPAEPPAPPMDMPPAPDAGMAPPPAESPAPLMPGQVSDANMKNVYFSYNKKQPEIKNAVVSDAAQKNIVMPMFKPSRGLIAAARSL